MKNIFLITGKDKFDFVKNYAILLIYNVLCFYKTILKELQRIRQWNQRVFEKCFKVTKMSLQSYPVEKCIFKAEN